MARQPSSKRHAVRLLLLIGGLLAAALVVRTMMIPDSFGEHGHYRAAAVEEIRAHEPRHQQQTVCADCHDDVAAVHAKDVHARVECETCHGIGKAHVESDGEGEILRPHGPAPCLVCHELMLARPGAFAQIRPEEHYELVGVADPEISCTRCHDPHEPLYLDRDLRTARLHPLVQRCRDCHAGRTDDTLPRPARHPEIFACDACHPAIAAAFADRPHHELRCTACHLFVSENEFSGRIIRDTDPRFCLLCHRDAEFRGTGAPPGIDWPDHRAEMAGEDSEESCVDCHQDLIHPLTHRPGD